VLFWTCKLRTAKETLNRALHFKICLLVVAPIYEKKWLCLNSLKCLVKNANFCTYVHIIIQEDFPFRKQDAAQALNKFVQIFKLIFLKASSALTKAVQL
jgi:ethanolamine utilization cobalamin adenosyltransferase